MVRQPISGERGFTLVEVMIAIVLLTFGVLAVADVLPHGLVLGLYGKDQTRSAGLAQQEIECLLSQATSTVGGFAGDYGSIRIPAPTACNPSSTATATTYLDQNGNATTQASAYFTRDVQVQYWVWNGTQFVISGTPYTAPSGGTYAYRVAVAVHWLVRNQTIYVSGQATNGCVRSGTAVPLGLGCVQVSTFVSP